MRSRRGPRLGDGVSEPRIGPVDVDITYASRPVGGIRMETSSSVSHPKPTRGAQAHACAKWAPTFCRVSGCGSRAGGRAQLIQAAHAARIPVSSGGCSVPGTCSRSLQEGLFCESVERRTSCRRRSVPIPSSRESGLPGPEPRVEGSGGGGPSAREWPGAMPERRRMTWPYGVRNARTSKTFSRGRAHDHQSTRHRSGYRRAR